MDPRFPRRRKPWHRVRPWLIGALLVGGILVAAFASTVVGGVLGFAALTLASAPPASFGEMGGYSGGDGSSGGCGGGD